MGWDLSDGDSEVAGMGCGHGLERGGDEGMGGYV